MASMNDETFRTGAQLFAEWGCKTRDQKLERACAALMEQLNELHSGHHGHNLLDRLSNQSVTCSCADAYRMGYEALKGTPLEMEIKRRAKGGGTEAHLGRDW